MIWRSIIVGVAGLVLLLGTFTVSAEDPTPTPTPSFDMSATVTTSSGTIPGPGCPYTGGWTEFSGPDGTRYAHISQINVITGCETPTPAPTPEPTAAPASTTVDDPALTYFGTWAVYTGSGKYGPGDHWTATSGSAYGLLFTGTAVTLYMQTAPWMAIASVSVDGGPAVDFDAYATTTTQQVAFFRSAPLAPGVHRVIVRHTGRWNPAATEHQLTVDRVDITGGVIVPPLTQ
jgi:mannan endo-1,4-beta-mannosidase